MGHLREHSLKKALGPAKKRIILRHLLKYMVIGVIASLGLVVIIRGVSFFIPIESVWKIGIVAGVTLILASVIIGWFKRPSLYKIAKTVDKMGLKEKVITACELSDREDTFAQLQRQDAIVSLNGLNTKSISLRMPKIYYYIITALAFSLVLAYTITNPMDTVIKQRKQLKAELNEQLEELQTTVDESLANEDIMTEEQRLALAGLVNELTEELKETSDYKEALKEISKTEDELSSLIDKMQEENIADLTQQLNQHGVTQSLASAINSTDARDIQAQVDQLKEQLEESESGNDTAKELQDALKKTAESLPTGGLKDGIASIASKLEGGQNSEGAMEELSELLNNATNSESTTGEVKYSLQQMRNKLARSIGENGTQLAQDNSESSSESESSNNSESPSPNEGNSGQPGDNSEGNQGIGESNQGTGQGNEGNGQGNEGSGSSGNSGNVGQGSGIGNGSTNDEQIYAPERLGDGGEITYVPGQNSNSGETTSEDGGRGIGDLSGFIPYREVFLEYKSEAMAHMERRTLPSNIQGLVRDYFTSLDE